MTDEPTLPAMPRGRPSIADASTSRRFKRARFSSPAPCSSDPVMFSSDDDPSADNYAARNRSKRKFRGPWYSQKPDEDEPEVRRERKSLSRQFDSAVWIGSDATDSDAEFSSQLTVTLPTMSPQRAMMRQATKRNQPTPEELVQKLIESCLEAGTEHIDLSSRHLTSLSNATVKPLSTLVIVPRGSQGFDFKNLRPALKIFLASNELQRLPGEICELRGLSVLSLRNNRLIELQSAIGRLRRLVELNISNNSLHYLPYEILDLLSGTSRLQTFTIHPNQFYEPFDKDLSPIPSASTSPNIGLHRPPVPKGALHCTSPSQDRQWLRHWDIKYRCRSQVRFFDKWSGLMKGPAFPQDNSLFSSPCEREALPNAMNRRVPKSLTVPVAKLGDTPQPPTSYTSSHAPSLLEIATRTWSRSTDQPELKAWLNSEEDVESLSRILLDARLLRETEAGDRRCTMCTRIFVIPRTEWIEWWEIAKAKDEKGLASAASPLRQMENKRDQIEKMVPLIRRGCSWRCIPNPVVLEEDPPQKVA